MGRATSKGNETKWKTKQLSDMPTPNSNTGGSDLWSSTLPLDHGGATYTLYTRIYIYIYIYKHMYTHKHMPTSYMYAYSDFDNWENILLTCWRDIYSMCTCACYTHVRTSTIFCSAVVTSIRKQFNCTL